MKRFICKIIPFILLFIMLFSVPVGATNMDDMGEYPLHWYSDVEFCGMTPEEVCYQAFLYAQTQRKCIGWNYDGVNCVIFQTSADSCSILLGANTIYGDDTGQSFTPGSTLRFRCRASAVHVYISGGSFTGAYDLASWDNFHIRLGIDSVLYANRDIYTNNGVIPLISGTPLISEKEDSKQDKPALEFPNYNYDSIVENKDEKESVLGALSSIQQETVDSSDATSNVFLRVFQSISTIISNVYDAVDNVRDILHEFVSNFSENVMSFFESALAIIADKIDSIDYGLQEFYDVIYQIHSTGLNADGKFELSVFFKYWFVPSENYFSDSLSNVVNSVPVISSIVKAANTLYSVLANLEAVAPVITIPPLTFGDFYFPGMNITFDWFLAWKPYTDALLTVLIYYGFVIHFIKNLPNIISGSPSIPAEKPAPDEPLSTYWDDGIFRK